MKGTTLIAIDPCYMNGDKKYPALTVGKAYIVNAESNNITIHSNMGEHHQFPKKSLNKYFKIQSEIYQIY